MRKGYIQVYTGRGKGKTTAVLGLALRAAGAGLKVFIAQFIKKRKCSEHKALERFKDLITVKQYGTGFLKDKKPTKTAIEKVHAGFEDIKKIISSNTYDVIILDEINLAIHYKLLDADEVINTLKSRPPGVEVVLTGRYADDKILEIADLVTEMKEIKHYYKKAVKARKGIEY